MHVVLLKSCIPECKFKLRMNPLSSSQREIKMDSFKNCNAADSICKR